MGGEGSEGERPLRKTERESGRERGAGQMMIVNLPVKRCSVLIREKEEQQRDKLEDKGRKIKR